MSEYQPKQLEYDRMYQNEETHWWYKGLRDVLFRWIGKINPRSTLDAGCGTGINIRLLQDIGRQVSGVDLSESALNYCKSRGIKDLSLASLTSLPFESNKFDCIYSCDVIGCLTYAEAQKAVKEFERCLKPGGYLIINTAALQWLFSKHDMAWDMKKRYSKPELKDLLEKNGFQILNLTYRVFLLFVPIAVAKLLARNADYEDSDMQSFNPAVNAFLTLCMRIESLLLKYVSLPIGTSVFAVAKKQ